MIGSARSRTPGSVGRGAKVVAAFQTMTDKSSTVFLEAPPSGMTANKVTKIHAEMKTARHVWFREVRA
jgi:hypothetical protein